ncbi:signal peptide-containing protein [Theileria equi strain WA]|uniref:Signal peptide-containing protein n=1 Tax=Theileria equi strain WA TaxID=1537102 RepID=L0B0C4_THEEQ|nr:signal peptide-containing protein [Theileria equi strain WA]AFZ80716.1 signal peptide-containing protein [Theileria equi strain WA]|eukprot:XP_004830382.1 signal peptide-containing protein [Theileria equi strain WA]
MSDNEMIIAVLYILLTIASCYLGDPKPIDVDIRKIDKSLFNMQVLEMNGISYTRYLSTPGNIVIKLMDGDQLIWDGKTLENAASMFSVDNLNANTVVITTHGEVETIYNKTPNGWEKGISKDGGFKVEVLKHSVDVPDNSANSIKPNNQTSNQNSHPTIQVHSEILNKMTESSSEVALTAISYVIAIITIYSW